MRAVLLMVSSCTLMLALWAGANRAPFKSTPDPLIQAQVEAKTLPDVDRERILPLIEKGRSGLAREIAWRRSMFSIFYVAGFVIGVAGLVAGIRGPAKRG